MLTDVTQIKPDYVARFVGGKFTREGGALYSNICRGTIKTIQVANEKMRLELTASQVRSTSGGWQPAGTPVSPNVEFWEYSTCITGEDELILKDGISGDVVTITRA